MARRRVDRSLFWVAVGFAAFAAVLALYLYGFSVTTAKTIAATFFASATGFVLAEVGVRAYESWDSGKRATAVLVSLGLIGLADGFTLIVYSLSLFDVEGGPSIPTSTVPATTGPPTSSTGSTTPPTAPPPTTPPPPVYTIDIDHDGKIDFVESGNQLVAVPRSPSNNGPVIVALIGGIFLVAATLGAAFVTALSTRSKREAPTIVVQYPPPPSGGDRGE
jgi:hypothetical protein